MDADEIDRLRARQSEADDLATQAPGSIAAGSRGFLAITTNVGAYPTAAGSFFMVQAVDVFGAEVEGGAGTTTAVGGKFPAMHVGSTVPPIGARVWVEGVPYRWVFQY